jgi:hypothetical protein
MNMDQITNKLSEQLRKSYSSIISVYSDKGEHSMTLSHTQEDFKFLENEKVNRKFLTDDVSINFDFLVKEGVCYISFSSNKNLEQSLTLKSNTFPIDIIELIPLDWNKDYILLIGTYKFWISVRKYTN